jgi:hypothetical protein
MNTLREGSPKRLFGKVCRFTVWLLICALFLPAPLAVNAAPAPDMAGAEPWNRHLFERWNGPERARALEEAARLDAAARDESARSEAAASVAPVARQETAARSHSVTPGRTVAAVPTVSPGAASIASTDASRPKSVTEVLFNYGAGFMGVPGLAPRQGVDGSLDEGLGFHQDGTARKAGGVVGSSGPSANGQRARTYMQSGLQSGYGMNGFGLYGNNLYDEQFGDLWGRNDPTRGGRIGAGNSYSRDLGDFDPLNMAIDRGLNYGAGFLNSMGEAGISSLVDGGRARLNFRLDRDGYFSGEGDALLPWYDGKYTTFYTQLGARSMHDNSDTRWIGNFGIGQRWFPLATGEALKSADYDAGNLMLGYNAFFDYDFTRDHQRGGIGAEAQWDWFRLSTNYYFPLSSWKGSEDFDSRFVKERPAEGWDARVKAYLPFYRNVAITGAYSQWFGDHVGMFGADNLEKDPKVWSYGVEYTPIPLVSGFVTQRSTERGRTDTEFGLNFTYHFGMSWEDQTSHSKVAELRTVGGSRHEFVDRENRIILEYKAKNSYQIEYLGPDGARGFLFRIRDGFGEFKAGQTVRVTASGAYLAEAKAHEPPTLFANVVNFLDDLISVSSAYAADLSKTYVTDGQGRFWVRLDNTAPASVSVTVQAGENSQTFMLAGGSGGASGTINGSAGAFSSGVSTATLSLSATDSQGNAVTSGNVEWTITSIASNTNQAVTTEFKSSLAGLSLDGAARLMPTYTWASTPSASSVPTVTPVTKDISQSITLSDIVGERVVEVSATITIDGSPRTFTGTVSFGDGPLAAFRLPSGEGGYVGNAQWANASPISNASSLPAADMCGANPSGYTSWNGGDHSGDTNLPTRAELWTVAGGSGNGAWLAAGWRAYLYWSGELDDDSVAYDVYVVYGSSTSYGSLDDTYSVVCRHQ